MARWIGSARTAGELHRDWRNDVEVLGSLFAAYIPDYRNLMNSYAVKGTRPRAGA
jgi:hypothetical protein